MYKTKFIFSILLVLAVTSVIVFTGSSSTSTHERNSIHSSRPLQATPMQVTSGNISDSFLVGAIDDGWDLNFKYLYDSVGFNVWHKYCGDTLIGTKHYPNGWVLNGATNDKLFATESEYTGQVQNLLNTVSEHHLRNLMARPKIDYLCYGQRSDYRCVDVSKIENQDYYFYTFQSPSHVGYDDTDSFAGHGIGYYVRHCRPGNSTNGGNWVDNAGYVVSRLKANTEQCSKDGYDYKNDSECDWLLKPRIRIPQDFVIPANYETPVCSIKVIAQDSTVLKNTIIKAKYFRVDNNGASYNGEYIEEYNFFGEDTLKLHGAWLGNDTVGKWWYRARGSHNPDYQGDNHADIQVYWYGNCDMWLDYVRVDNDIADGLFKGIYDNTWLQWEARDIACYGNGNSQLEYYIELFEFNNTPCIAYVNHKLDSLCMQSCGKHITVMGEELFGLEWQLPWDEVGNITSPEMIKRLYFDRTGSRAIFIGDPYPINATPKSGCYGNWTQYSKIPQTLPKTTGDSILANAVPPAEYDTWLQSIFDTTCFLYEGNGSWGNTYQYLGVYEYLLKKANAISKLYIPPKPIIVMQQAHQWESVGEVDRDPTNEETNMMTNLAVSYGAKGIMYWSWETEYDSACRYNWGLIERDQSGNFIPRYKNVYGEPKWDTLKRIVQRLKTWGPYLMNFMAPNSYIYRNQSERCDMRQNSIINSLATYYNGTGQNCPQDNCPPPNLSPPSPQNMAIDCPNNTYLQASIFYMDTYHQDFPYFMIVNKRCSPAPDGNRDVRILFNPQGLTSWGYNNWTIINLYDKSTQTISLNPNGWVDLGQFAPGEGRLYWMVPTIVHGGILASDEVINGNVTCQDTIFNNGYNITINNGSSLHFTDTSSIIMNGGTFTSGDVSYSGPPNITINAVSNNNFHGLHFQNCNVKIYNTNFTNIASDTTFSLNCIDCPVIDIRNNNFTYSNEQLNGGINITCYNNSSFPPNVYIGANTFNSGISTLPSINAMSYAAITVPMIIENNFFNGNQTIGNNSIILSGITGGAIKTNTFTDCDRAMSFLSSSLDITGNTISSSVSGSKSIQGLSGSELRMTRAKGYFLGGLNNINNTGTSSSNIYLENSDVIMNQGQNIFNINDQSGFHLNGYFPISTSIPTSETNNCFKLNNNVVDPPYENITWGDQGSSVSFTFDPYMSSCTQGSLGGDMVINLGNNIYDSIPTSPGGGGNPDFLPLAKGESKRGSLLITTTAKQLYDSISIQMRYRNYTYVKTKCQDLINTFPDSIESLNAISKLYLATSASDTSHTGRVALKTYYENLILNYGYNLSLVNRCNYFIQKCKVLLHQYNDALAGFQAIMNNNPYSYEGLVARWDYMATSLLMEGQGGGDPTLTLPEGEGINPDDLNKLNEEYLNKEYPENDNEMDSRIRGNDNGPRDGSPWSKEEKKNIKQAINKSFESSKNFQDKKIEILTKEAEKGNEDAKKNLEVAKTIKNIVKTHKPKNIQEHVKIVTSDIQKILVVTSNKKSGKSNVFIPTEFALYQNFPNPFNPVTKIMYDIPKDAKVKITVYDLLGREVIKLVNNELKQAGRYYVDFNGNNFASGVYFYKIEAGKFVQSKKMVLVK